MDNVNFTALIEDSITTAEYAAGELLRYIVDSALTRYVKIQVVTVFGSWNKGGFREIIINDLCIGPKLPLL